MKRFLKCFISIALVLVAVLGVALGTASIIIYGTPVKEFMEMKQSASEKKQYVEVIESKIRLLLFNEGVQVVDLFVSEQEYSHASQHLKATVLIKNWGIQVFSIDTCILESSKDDEEQLMEILLQADYTLAEDEKGLKTIIYID